MIVGVKENGKYEKGLDVALYKPVMVWNHSGEEARTPDRVTISGTNEAPLPLKEPGGTRTDRHAKWWSVSDGRQYVHFSSMGARKWEMLVASMPVN